jgi:thiamine transport system permease protein
VDWPVLRRSLPGTLFLVFLLCASSFTIVLTLGGGPQATTLEVAIYQALRFDFDPARATLLALVQIALCGVLGLGVLHFAQRTEPQFRLRINRRRHDGHTPLSRMIDVGAMLLMVALLVPPLAALLVSGVSALHVQAGFIRALTTSLLFGLATSLLSGALAWMLASWAARSAGGARLSTLVSQAGLVLPPAVIATGWFILATRGPGLAAFALPLIIALNCLMALPFAYGALAPALRGTLETHDRLCGSLGISGWNRLRFIDLPAMTSPLSLALAMAALVSLGDLSAILFFGDGRYVTLPALIYQQMGSYRMEGAMGTALVLALLSLAVLWAAESWSRRHA